MNNIAPPINNHLHPTMYSIISYFQLMGTAAQSWDHLAGEFKDKPLSEIVQYCIAVGLSQRLFAFASLDKLVIGPNQQLEIDKETLHIPQKSPYQCSST